MIVDHISKKFHEREKDLLGVQIRRGTRIFTGSNNVVQSAGVDGFTWRPNGLVEAIDQLSYIHGHPPYITEDTEGRDVGIRNCTMELDRSQVEHRKRS